MGSHTWRDVTSYSRSEAEPRTPRTWSLDLPHVRVVVSRHRDYGPDVWLVRFQPLTPEPRPLKSKDLEAAKAEALATLRETVRDLGAALDEVSP